MSVPGGVNLAMLSSAGGGGAAGYQIDRSVRLNPADTAFFSKTFGSAGNRKTYTLSAWIKLCSTATNQYYLMASDNTYFCFTSTGQIEVNLRSGATNYFSTSNQVFRDFSAWQHIVWVVNTVSSAMEAYVNGVRITWSSRNVPANTDTDINRAAAHNLGKSALDPRYFDGYLAEVQFLDGLTPGTTTREVGGVTQTILTDFGEFDDNGVWQPIEYTGSYPGNSFYLDFADNSSTTSGSNVGIGKDVSGNGNYFNSNNISVTAGAGNDSLRDSPTDGNTADDTGAGGEVPGNYCTWNFLNPFVTTFTNGNLECTTDSGRGITKGTIGISAGKWYWEVTPTTSTSLSIGVAGASATTELGASSDGWGYLLDARKYNNSSATSYGVSYTANDVIGVALDMTAGTLTFYKNGSSQGQAFSGITGTVFPAASVFSSVDATWILNAGQRAFAYSAPSGYKALCTANLDDPTIADGSTAMDVALYTGNGTSQTISGLEFSPDFVWLKRRDSSQWHELFDQVRTAGNALSSNSNIAEYSSTALTAFTSDGFSVGSASEGNALNGTYAAWTWDGGSSTVSNTDGSITSSVRANASAGFSIVTYTGDETAGSTVGHGLGVQPHMVIGKNRGGGDGWYVWHKSASSGGTAFLRLNLTNGLFTTQFIANNTAPSSSVVTLGSDAGWNSSASPGMVLYCFAPVEGYSAFGSYTGSVTYFPFIWTGFRPRWIMFKNTTTARDWVVHDTARNTYNVINSRLKPNDPAAETTVTGIDSLSNGFKVRIGSGAGYEELNENGSTIVYAAFAENPFKIARAR